jgi:FHA domain
MSFRVFIYYCALCGAWAALAGWVLGRTFNQESPVVEAGFKGMCLGLFVSLALAILDSWWALIQGRVFTVGFRVIVAVLVGSLGGLIGGIIGQTLFGWKPWLPFLIFGWMFTGLLIGSSIGLFDVGIRYLRRQALGRTLRKLVNGILGGAAGGVLGGILSVLLRRGWGELFHDKPLEDLWSPSATGFLALGMCIGFLIGLAQVILKEAWVKVETGRRAGREIILTKPETRIGRAETCDIGLFGETDIERFHAQIVQGENRYVLTDLGTPSGTFLNGQRIAGPTPLQSGDAIRIGTCTLRFWERQKRSA